ncbi:MIOREX complex component 2 [Hondaea fermentalgiana]|uniref:MIOREX complex component 2 n=1 Tax=Hondaea fermentalgiana TaxID=2315210 RepID=A0A2R5GKU5_9STRA|nr:MIOREX complex component 2 [Hondaea fermentalgiana]|eukprot:GBG31500.1 MIOREX complex component 2 [Hondaea fermentalgiana]
MSKFKRVVVFGGSGFVGSTALELLALRGSAPSLVSVTRKGERPKHLEKQKWADGVSWEKGDSLKPASFEDKLDAETSIIVSIGSPPLPTSSDEAFQAQVKANGDTCVSIIETAAAQNVKRLVLVSATMPQWAPSGYREGKRKAYDAAVDFANGGSDRSALILKPSGIYGTRHTEGGLPIPLWTVMAPASLAMQGLSRIGISDFIERSIPSVAKGVLSPLVSVEAVARAAVDGATMATLPGEKNLIECSPEDILAYRTGKPTQT